MIFIKDNLHSFGFMKCANSFFESTTTHGASTTTNHTHQPRVERNFNKTFLRPGQYTIYNTNGQLKFGVILRRREVEWMLLYSEYLILNQI